jgi:hypothetical protein
MKRIYLVLAIVGAVIPYVFFLQFFSAEGVNLSGFISGLFVNGAVSGFAADMLISSFVFWVWMFQQQRRAKGPNPAIFIALNLLIGLSCALPAYLYAKSD